MGKNYGIFILFFVRTSGLIYYFILLLSLRQPHIKCPVEDVDCKNIILVGNDVLLIGKGNT